MPVNRLDSLFWAVGLWGNIGLLAVLLYKHRARPFPLFTTFIAASILRTTILYFVHQYGSVRAYFQWYVFLGLLDVSLQLGVVYEVASHVFRPLGRWAPDVRGGLRWLVWGSVASALALTILATPGATKWQFAALIKGDFFSSVLLSGLFLGLVVLSVTVGLPWRTHVARVSQGLGAYSLMDVIFQGLHTIYGTGYQAGIDDVLIGLRKTLYIAALGYWIVTLWRTAPETREVSAEMRTQLQNLNARVAYDLYSIRNWRKP